MKCATKSCHVDIKVPNRYKYCKACRVKYNQRKQKTPAKQKPQKAKPHPSLKKQKHPPLVEQQIQNVIASAIQEPLTSGRSRMQSNLSRVASAQKMANITAKKALPRLLLSALSPKAVQGQKPFRFNIDQSITPKKSYTYESTFTIKTTNEGDDFKILWFASPIIIAQITSKFPLEISGVRYISDRPREGGSYDYYMLGNKTGFLGEVDQDFTFLPVKDFKQYRCLLATGSMIWVGKEIDKNGTYWGARITDREELETFDPLAKADNVNTGVDGMISVTAQHINPIFDWTYIDDNDDEEVINKPDATLLEVINIICSDTSTKGALSYDGFVTPTAGTYNGAAFNLSLNNLFTTSSFNTDIAALFQDINNKYGNAFFKVNPTTGFIKFADLIEMSMTIRKVTTSPNGPGLSYLPQTETTLYDADLTNFTTLAAAIAAAMRAVGTNFFSNNVLPNSSGFSRIEVCFRAVLKTTELINQSLSNTSKIRTQLIPDIIEGIDQIAHMADQFLLPVVQVQTDNGRFQVTQTTVWELTVEDTSPFTMDTVASNNIDPDMTLSKGEMSRFLKVLNAMPPMLEFSGTQLSSYAATELNSRGIFGDISSILGPIASAIFPGASPIIGGLQSIIGGLNI